MIFWFLPGIIFLGIVTTYTDLKESKIKNKHIIIALTYSLIAYTLLTIINWGPISVGYFVELFVMCGFSLIMGFIIWHVGLWTAGDAKLFFAYSALVPLSVYKNGHIPYFDSTSILVNTVVPVSFCLVLNIMFKTNIKQKLLFLKQALQPKKVFSLATSLFAFLWVTTLLFKSLNIPMNYFIVIFLLFIIIISLEKIFLTKTFKVIIVISILRLILDTSVYSYSFVKEFLLALIVFILLRFFIIRLGFHFLTKKIDMGLLREGMIPAEAVYIKNGKYKKQNLIFFSLFDHFQEKVSEKNYLFDPSRPLIEQDINKILRLRKKLGFEHLKIQQTLPFAPFLFLGVLLTLLAQGNLVSVLAGIIFK